jgi:peptidoglycan/LPS O-acetylase OafA/YrhL
MKSLNILYNPRIDQLRWLAATVVCLFHFYGEYRGAGGTPLSSPWWGLLTEGHTGVGLFFTLSGFLFMQIALRQREIVYLDFLRNRVLRIFPLFLTIFLLATSIGRDQFQAADVLYIFATNLGNSPTSISEVTGTAWCISLEFLFYMVFPFLARFAMEQGPRYLLKLLVLMLFFKLAVYSESARSTHMYYSTFVGRFDQFVIGMLAAMVYRKREVFFVKHGLWLAPAAILLAVANSALQAKVAGFNATPKSVFWIFWSIQESAVWALLILAWVGFPGALPRWLDKAIGHGGKVSFSFYLLHMAVIHSLVKAFGLPVLTGHGVIDAVLLGALVYGATWALATLSYYVIEEPFLSMRRKYGAAKESETVLRFGTK